MNKTAIDLNCDMGESFGSYKMGFDEEVIRLISSANVGCGFHGGDPHVMRRTVSMAKASRVEIGAHPGLPDLMGFGRRAMEVTPGELKDFFTYQIGALDAFVKAAGKKLQHVKMHGALVAMALKRPELTVAMCEATLEKDPNLIWVTPSGLPSVDTARKMGLRVAQEFYADRGYTEDFALASRKLPGAVLHNPDAIAERLVRLLKTGEITTVEGKINTLTFDSICVHGDTPGAMDALRAIRKILRQHQISIKPMKDLV